jgi:hypothetical protein
MGPIQSTDPDLLEASPEQLMELFKTLPAPPIEEMHGEFNGSLLTQKNLAFDLAWRLALYNPLWPGIWVGKGFRPVSEDEGRGYNNFRRGSKIIQRFPMNTLIAPSRYDRKPAFQLVYRAYHSATGRINMVDEVRKLDDDRYLLIGTVGITKKQRHVPTFVLLEGTVRPYRGDIGRAYAKLSLDREIPQLHNPG